MSTRWTQFLKNHAGKGYTREELSKMYRRASLSSEGYRAARPSSAKRYRKASPSSKGYRAARPSKAKRSKKTSKSSKEKCRSLLSKKIKINMDEYHSGRWSSPKQAIAVSYSQIQKKYPKCKRHLARKTSKK